MSKAKTSRSLRIARHLRARKTLVGTPDRPRLCVFRSLSHIHAQVIDDSIGQTIVSASTLELDTSGTTVKTSKSDKSKLIGKNIATRALKKGIKQVVFDRGGFTYHGRVQQLAEAARKGGLVF